MNLTTYTSLRFVIYFIVFAMLIMTCSNFWPGSFFGKWYTIAAVAIALTLIEFFVINKKEPCTQCLNKENLKEVCERLEEIGYQLTDKKVDRLIFLKKTNPIRWEIAEVAFKKNCVELEIAEEEMSQFDEWRI